MKSTRRSTWALLVVLCCSCKSEDSPAADPLDDPWVDAVDTGDEQPIVVAGPELLAPVSVDAPDAPEAPPADAEANLAEANPIPEAPPASAASHAPATASKSATSAAAPEQPAAEAPAVDEQPAKSTSAPAVQPASSPSAEPAQPASPPPITSADYHGNYRYAGGNTQRDEVAAAIEATIEQLPKALHGIARKRLTQANPVDGTIDIVIAGDKITTTFEAGFHATCVIDGPAVDTRGKDGEKLAVRVQAKGSKLVQVLQGKEGARTIVYTLSADRKKLTVHHKITADRLPEPLTYRLSYSRK
jgi:hypothetical protein